MYNYTTRPSAHSETHAQSRLLLPLDFSVAQCVLLHFASKVGIVSISEMRRCWRSHDGAFAAQCTPVIRVIVQYQNGAAHRAYMGTWGRFLALDLLAICPKLALLSTCTPTCVRYLARIGILDAVPPRTRSTDRTAPSASIVSGVRDGFRTSHSHARRHGPREQNRLRALLQVGLSL